MRLPSIALFSDLRAPYFGKSASKSLDSSAGFTNCFRFKILLSLNCYRIFLQNFEIYQLPANESDLDLAADANLIKETVEVSDSPRAPLSIVDGRSLILYILYLCDGRVRRNIL